MDTGWLAVLAVLGGAVVVYLLNGRGRPSNELIGKALDDGALLVDVRSPAEFASRHAPGALNLPLQTLDPAHVRGLAGERQVVVYCASGMRSASAARALKAAGIDTLDAGPLTNLPKR